MYDGNNTNNSSQGGQRRGGPRQSSGPARDPADEKIVGKVFIGGLSADTTKEDLDEYFSQFGAISDSVVMRDSQNSNKSRGFGFVTFEDPASIDNVQAKRPHKIKNKQVDTKRAMPRSQSTSNATGRDQNAKVFIRAIPSQTTDEEFRTYCETFGEVQEVHINRKSGPKYYGFATFVDFDAADKMVLTGNHTLHGEMINVQKSIVKNKQQQQQFNNQGYGAAPYGSAPQYGAPYGQQSAYGSSAYGAPAMAPQQQYSPYGTQQPQAYGAPAAGYGASQPQSGAPSSYGAQYGATPQQQQPAYGAVPAQQHQSAYGAPAGGYGASAGYGAAQASYGAASTGAASYGNKYSCYGHGVANNQM